MSITHLQDASEGESGYKQVTMSLWHPGCWTLQVTENHEETHIIEKSIYPTEEVIKGDFILVTEGETTIDEFSERINEYEVVNDIAIIHQSKGRARAIINYESDSSIVPEIVNSDFMPIEPVHITGGQEYWTVMVRESTMSDVVGEMESKYDVEINTIEAVDPSESLEFADVINRIHDDLSTRQRECLFKARDAGYYNWPRDVSAKEVADDTVVSAPTFLEHIRRGEHKIFSSVFDELERRQKRH